MHCFPLIDSRYVPGYIPVVGSSQTNTRRGSMSCPRLAACALAVGALAIGACGSTGSSSKSPSRTSTPKVDTTNIAVKRPQSSAPLTRAQLVAQGDAICYRLNARRMTTKVARAQDYEQLVPALAAYELQGANELGALAPPRSMAHLWRQIVSGSHKVAEATGHFPHYSEAANDNIARVDDEMLTKAIDELTGAARRGGFKECSRFL
jgi:hypothetical protein